MKLKSYIHAECLTSDKSLWVKSAQSEKLKLNDWIIKTLNEKTHNSIAKRFKEPITGQADLQ